MVGNKEISIVALTRRLDYNQYMYRYLSNGSMYDKLNRVYIEFDRTKPQPHNRIQTPLFYLNVRKITDLTAEELTYLMCETRLSKPECVKTQRWYIEAERKRRREYDIRSLQHDYYWEVCAKIQYKYTKEQLEKMPWQEARHKKHERVIGPTLWEWAEQCRPNKFHALWGRRKTLPGVARSLQKRYNRRITRKHRRKNAKTRRLQTIPGIRTSTDAQSNARTHQISRAHEHRKDCRRRRYPKKHNRAINCKEFTRKNRTRSSFVQNRVPEKSY